MLNAFNFLFSEKITFLVLYYITIKSLIIIQANPFELAFSGSVEGDLLWEFYGSVRFVSVRYDSVRKL